MRSHIHVPVYHRCEVCIVTEFKAGDIVRRLSDDVLMAVDYADDSLACCHFLEPVMPSKTIFIAIDALEIVQLHDEDSSQL